MNSASETSKEHQWLMVIADTALLLFAAISFVYSVVTALGNGKDLATFQVIGRAWAAGVYRTGEGPLFGYPPFASVLLAPFALLSFDQLRAVFVAVNLLATVAILLLVKRLWGEAWPAKAYVYLAALVICWAPFRVTVRNGQISLIITTLVLGSLLARKRGASVLAGLLLGLSLCKYPLTLPFVLYFVWRREWKIAAAAGLTVALLTEAFALRLGLSLFDVTGDYVRGMLHISITNSVVFAGVTEIGPLLFALTGNEQFADWLNITLIFIAALAMCLVFWKTPHREEFHITILTFFSLWFVYHRVYDAVICVLPAAVFFDLIVRGRARKLGSICVAALGLLAVSVPGLLTERLHLSGERLAANPLGLLGLHLERLLVFVMFWSLLILLWNRRSRDRGEPGSLIAIEC
ncbi:MAG TPA: glycosyltransferase family 87 protein [Blastocatellia bacterium]|nr:glycosyltransferase family 87 protein [Blastocatellia bacterium]